MASIISEKHQKQNFTLKELKTIGRDLLSSRSHVNNLTILLTFISPDSPPQFTLESLLSLQSFFTPLIAHAPAASSKLKGEDPEVVYRKWVMSKFDEFEKCLINVLVSEKSEDALREIVLDTLMEFVKMGKAGKFRSSIYHSLLDAILQSAVAVDVFSDLLASKYFKYIDVRYFSYISIEKLVNTLGARDSENGAARSHSKESLEHCIRKVHKILSHIPPLEKRGEDSEHEMLSGSGFPSKDEGGVEKKFKAEKQDSNVLSPATIAKRMKLKFTKAWISFLRLPLPLDVYKEVLSSLHQAVIPHLSKPAMLCDFLTKSYDIGGVISIMALSSLFILITQHGLEYPMFYDKLYALLVPSIFMAKHRAKFFQLLDACLKSPMLPAYLAASFTKKLSWLSLSVPPSGSLVIIALIHNLLRRHPSINCLVHREASEDTEYDNSKVQESVEDAHDDKVNTKKACLKPGVDHFNHVESNPMKSNAMRSSLWEIDTLRHHYCPPVSRFVLSLENDLTVRAKTTEVNIEDFSSGSYATIFGDEIRRRVKQVPLAFYKVAPTSLFAESDFAGWTFKYGEEEQGNRNDAKTSEKASKENGNVAAKRQRVECS